MKRAYQSLSLLMVIGLLLAACGPAETTGSGPYRITGSFEYTNSIITDYYTEQAVALVDMYGFVTRDLEWEIPVSSQTLGFLSLDAETMIGEYFLDLPLRPAGTQADVDNDAQAETGVQVYAVSYWPNLYGGPYSEGDDPSRGWPSYLASVLTDTENKDEVIGGKLVVWAPDARQSFPSGFGDDGLLFTADDPVAELPAGWSIVDLDQTPFVISTEAEPVLTLYEPQDVAIKDFSEMSYTDAFEAMFEFVSTNYAFNGIEGKQPDWEALYAEIQPRIDAAESADAPNVFWLALRDFTWAFQDGHVGVSSSDYGNQLFSKATAGGYGLALGELDNGSIVVIYLSAGGPAETAGIQIGAEVSEFDGRAIDAALAEVRPFSLPISQQSAVRYQQLRYLLRGEPGDEIELTFTNPGGETQSVSLTAVQERDSFSRTSIYFNAPDETYLPVNFSILESGAGYIRINSNYDDLNLIIKLFERALKTFEAEGVTSLIIDMRFNSGGANLGLAGFLTDLDIPMGQLEYYSETTGQFEPEGVRDVVRPNVEQYRFEHMATLVGPACYSACELEAYGFSQVPGMEVVGMYPSAGTEAEVARGQILMPDGIFMQFPTGRFLLPDGSIFLEGVGVQPTVFVPRSLETLTSTEDVVLQTAEQVVLGR
jgi:C-terminal processing protease CtpA/Prc